MPTCQQQSEFAVGAQKISKATVLQKSEMRDDTVSVTWWLWRCSSCVCSEDEPDRIICLLSAAIDYIHFLHKEKKKQEEEVSVLRKEVMALKIMKT